jgi:predicted DNA-binding protein
MRETSIRLPEETADRLRVLASLASIRQKRFVAPAALIRAAIDQYLADDDGDADEALAKLSGRK